MNFEIEFEVGKDSKWWEKNENEELARKEGKPKKPKKKNKIKYKKKGEQNQNQKSFLFFQYISNIVLLM